MYVDTLITLQENLTTYAVEGKKVTGHVTINSPGMIKCYVQNLKEQQSGKEYAFYAFSKAKDKGVRIGKLGKNKETKWIVDEKNIQSSGLKLSELDGVAIVSENDMRGADTVAMGFKNNRYIIIPLIDDIVKTMQSKQSYTVSSQPSTNTTTNSTATTTTSNTTTNKHFVKPDPIIKGETPVSQNYNQSNGQYNLKDMSPYSGNLGQSNQSSNGVNNTNSNDNNNYSNSMMPNNTGTSNNATSSNNSSMNSNVSSSNNMSMSNNANSSNAMDQIQDNNNSNTDMGQQDSAGNNNPDGENVDLIFWETPLNDNGQQENSVNQGNIVMNTDNGNMAKTSEKLEDSNYTKKSVLQSSTQTADGEMIEDNESELEKIAQTLQEIENDPAIVKGVESGIPITTGKPVTATTVRDDLEDTPQSEEDIDTITERTAQELEKIIDKLKEDQTIRSKIQEIERQLVKLHDEEDRASVESKSPIEEKLEARYVEKQDNDIDSREEREIVEEVEDIDVLEENSMDTSPRNALTFIHACIKEFKEKGLHTLESIKKPITNKQEKIQDEVNYINEIDRRIKEIEERRKQERDKQ